MEFTNAIMIMLVLMITVNLKDIVVRGAYFYE
jgi:hypothetical protein